MNSLPAARRSAAAPKADAVLGEPLLRFSRELKKKKWTFELLAVPFFRRPKEARASVSCLLACLLACFSCPRQAKRSSVDCERVHTLSSVSIFRPWWRQPEQVKGGESLVVREEELRRRQRAASPLSLSSSSSSQSSPASPSSPRSPRPLASTARWARSATGPTAW